MQAIDFNAANAFLPALSLSAESSLSSESTTSTPGTSAPTTPENEVKADSFVFDTPRKTAAAVTGGGALLLDGEPEPASVIRNRLTAATTAGRMKMSASIIADVPRAGSDSPNAPPPAPSSFYDPAHGVFSPRLEQDNVPAVPPSTPDLALSTRRSPRAPSGVDGLPSFSPSNASLTDITPRPSTLAGSSTRATISTPLSTRYEGSEALNSLLDSGDYQLNFGALGGRLQPFVFTLYVVLLPLRMVILGTAHALFPRTLPTLLFAPAAPNPVASTLWPRTPAPRSDLRRLELYFRHLQYTGLLSLCALVVMVALGWRRGYGMEGCVAAATVLGYAYVGWKGFELDCRLLGTEDDAVGQLEDMACAWAAMFGKEDEVTEWMVNRADFDLDHFHVDDAEIGYDSDDDLYAEQ